MLSLLNYIMTSRCSWLLRSETQPQDQESFWASHLPSLETVQEWVLFSHAVDACVYFFFNARLAADGRNWIQTRRDQPQWPQILQRTQHSVSTGRLDSSQTEVLQSYNHWEHAFEPSKCPTHAREAQTHQHSRHESRHTTSKPWSSTSILSPIMFFFFFSMSIVSRFSSAWCMLSFTIWTRVPHDEDTCSSDTLPIFKSDTARLI